MCSLKPGDEVVCVDAAPRDFRRVGLVEGQTYTIASATPWGRRTCVTLVEVYPTAGAPGWWSDRFRKVNRRNTDLSIESFLTIKPGFEEPRRPKAPAKKEPA